MNINLWSHSLDHARCNRLLIRPKRDKSKKCGYSLKHMYFVLAIEFLWGSIFTDGQTLPFHRLNFCGHLHSCPLCTIQSNLFVDLIFEVRQSSKKTLKIARLKNSLLCGIIITSWWYACTTGIIQLKKNKA